MTRAEVPVGSTLLVESIAVDYGHVRALFDFSLEVPAGKVVAVLGPNGAGKSTVARALSGLVRCAEGRICFGADEISRLPAHRIARLGIAAVPEGRGVYPALTVDENLRMGVRRVRSADRRDALTRAYDLFPALTKRSRQQASTLSGGEQQMLALGRVLVTSPKLLIADEISLGLAPNIVTSLFSTLETIRSEGISIVLIEQFVDVALELADKAIVLQHGRVVWSGDASDAGHQAAINYLSESQPL